MSSQNQIGLKHGVGMCKILLSIFQESLVLFKKGRISSFLQWKYPSFNSRKDDNRRFFIKLLVSSLQVQPRLQDESSKIF